MKNKKRNLWDKFTVFSILLTMFQKEKTDAQFKKAPQFNHNTNQYLGGRGSCIWSSRLS